MDSYEGTVMLEWWANRSTCLGRFGVQVVRTAEDTWSSKATLESSLTTEDKENLDFLMQLDPHFTLRFDDASTLLVKVVKAGAEGRLRLTAAEGDTTEPTGTRHAPHQ
ncbi:hypothetical protein [Streptomyces sp. AM 2-1-1]|uniref:hypothetical protein n=1 Tax=unclassified Streptomyces TaxID=2593676 RepID=UPI0023B9835A|nr:hypothetical protein [Streptomyces sp. AM 2-1-1]WEH43092.1 hypothetical protein PZB77_28295 [Streptomyces sp. AM 2-1-1]